MKEPENTTTTAPGHSGDTQVFAATPSIPDYSLIRVIGSGAFGEIWLARSRATGRHRAIKIVHRARLPDQQTYELEFAGLKRFEEVSREHLGFVDILHISRHDQSGYFYYVMELADDAETGQQISEDHYQSRTLATDLRLHGMLQAQTCAQVGMAVAEALEALHGHGLVHRDIKPSNIVFVRGSPKLADIGLVTEVQSAPHAMLAGTPEFMDREVHGTIAGDLYSLGRILYVMASGRPAKEWPAWPEEASRIHSLEDFAELDRIFRKACHEDRSQRYRSGQEMIEDLRPLRVSASIRRLRKLERRFANLKRYGVAALLVAGAVLFGVYEAGQKQWHASQLRQRHVGSYVAYGTRELETGNPLGAIPWFTEALNLDKDNEARARNHRVRIASVLQNSPTLVQMWFNNRGICQPTFAGQENQVVAPAADGRWAVLDLVSGQPISPLVGRGGSNETASFSASVGRILTSDDKTNRVILWDLATGQELRQFLCPTSDIKGVLSPDGRWVAAAAAEGPILLWEAETGRPGPVPILRAHTAPVISLVFSHDSRRLVTVGEDWQALVWEPETGRKIHALGPHGSWVYHAAFSPNDKLIATTCFDRKTRLWDAETGRQLPPPFEHHDGVFSACFGAGGETLALACMDFAVRIFDVPSRRLLHLLPHDAKPVSAFLSPQGRHLVTASHDGTVRVWNLEPRQTTYCLETPGISADGRYCVQQTNGAVHLLDVPNLRSMCQTPMDGQRVLRALVTPDANRVLLALTPGASGDTNQVELAVWDCRAARLWTNRIAAPWPLANLELSPQGDHLALFTTNQFDLFNLKSGRNLLSLAPGAACAAFDATGHRLAIGQDTNAIVFPITDGRISPGVQVGHGMLVGSVAWSHKGHYLLTTCRDNSFHAEAARVWDSATGTLIGHPLSHRDGLRLAVFSEDDELVLTCGEDFAAILWDRASGRQKAPPLMHKHQVIHGAFSRDGRWVATASRDGGVRLWSVETGEPITPTLFHGDNALRVGFPADDRLLCALNSAQQLRVWKLTADLRPVEDLRLVSALLSAQQMSPSDIVRTPSRESLRETWQYLRENYPGQFGLRQR